jgi:hypothetical protein
MSIMSDFTDEVDSISNWTLIASVLIWFRSIEMFLMNAKYCS